MPGRLASKVVIVTGGSTGIGLAVARRVAAEGGAVVLAGRRPETGEQAAAGLRQEGGRGMYVPADVTVEADAERLIQAAVAGFGRLTGAVNNAGGVNATGLPAAHDPPLRLAGRASAEPDRRLLGVGPGAELGPAPNPSGRVASPDEIAAFAAFLLSHESAFITGAALPIDGGVTAQ